MLLGFAGLGFVAYRLRQRITPEKARFSGPADDARQPGELGVQRLIASCLNDACRHTALIDVSSYPAETEVPYFKSRVVCAAPRSDLSAVSAYFNYQGLYERGKGRHLAVFLIGRCVTQRLRKQGSAEGNAKVAPAEQTR